MYMYITIPGIVYVVPYTTIRHDIENQPLHSSYMYLSNFMLYLNIITYPEIAGATMTQQNRTCTS